MEPGRRERGAARAGIRPIMCRTERTVTNMADAYTRTLKGQKIGVCLVQSGPGIENAVIAISLTACNIRSNISTAGVARL